MNLPYSYMLALGLATLVCGAAAAIALAIDKRRAQRGGWRVSEGTLHTLELFGGWAGSLIARKLFRHKTRKASYRVVAGAISASHLAAWSVLVLWSLGVFR